MRLEDTHEFSVTNPHGWIALAAFAFTIILTVTSPRIPLPNLYVLIIKPLLVKYFPSKFGPRVSTNQVSRNTLDFDDVDTPQVETNQSDVSVVHHSADEIANLEEQERKAKASKFVWIPIDLGVAPIIAIVILFCTTTLSLNTFVAGIVGNEHIKPYSVLILFMSLSYCCISLDLTGLFEFIARKIIILANNSGHKLYISFCIFASVLTIFTSNDIVILTLTPIICYMSVQSENLDPIPFVVSQFFLANIWSISLEIGNPTNIIVAEAIRLNFLNYSKWLALPAIGAGVTCFILLYLVFFRSIPRTVITKAAPNKRLNSGLEEEEDDEEALHFRTSIIQADALANNHHHDNHDNIHIEHHDEKSHAKAKQDLPKLNYKLAAVVKTLLLFLCLVSLGASSLIVINDFVIPAYTVTVLFLVFFLACDVIQDIILIIRLIRDRDLPNAPCKSEKFVIWAVLQRVPWKIIPFALGMFIIVEVLKVHGFVGLFAKYISSFITLVAGNSGLIASEMSFLQRMRGAAASVFTMTYLSSVACNVLNNQPMTILFTDILQDSHWVKGTTEMDLGAQMGLIIGSNLGANITLIGALAGILWISILKQFKDPKIDRMNFFRFFGYGILITPIVIFVPSLILVLELMVFK